jgi:hypothetical protein
MGHPVTGWPTVTCHFVLTRGYERQQAKRDFKAGQAKFDSLLLTLCQLLNFGSHWLVLDHLINDSLEATVPLVRARKTLERIH